MKSEHRHDLKTNELAEWLANLPQWAKENLTTILVILAVVVIGVIFLIWRSYNKNVLLAREHIEFSNLLNQVSVLEAQIPGAQAEGRDLSFQLLQPAESLGNFAQNTSDSRMAALALIEQADAYRAELLYRPGSISKKDLTDRINQAKTAYTEAIQKASDNATLKASAEFGLGLCEEELGNFEKAKKIYQGIADNDEFEGTIAKAAAKNRLRIMADYKQTVVFEPAPAPMPDTAAQPTIQMGPVDFNSPPVSQPAIQMTPVPSVPMNQNQQSQALEIFPDVNSKVPEPNVSGK